MTAAASASIIDRLRGRVWLAVVAVSWSVLVCQPVATARAATDPSGVPMPVGDIPGWHQVLADDFVNHGIPIGKFSGCFQAASLVLQYCSGLSVWPTEYKNWWAYPDGWAPKCRTATGIVYEPSKVLSENSGVLDYYIHSASGLYLVAASVPKIPGGVNGGGLLHGRYSIRVRFANLPGYNAAFTLWPDNNIWQDGEIDWPELRLSTTTTIGGFVHSADSSRQNAQVGFYASANPDVWHTYTTEWTAGAVKFYLDGKLIGTDTAHVPTTPMHWVLQVNSCNYMTMSMTVAGHIQVDWATAYTPT